MCNTLNAHGSPSTQCLVALPALLCLNGAQAAIAMSKLQLTRKDLAASQLLTVQQAMQLNQQGQQLAELSTRCKQLEQQLLATQQQVSHANANAWSQAYLLEL
jgi:septal ring factor EnvC (AmiA/AmiB activator)